MLGMSESTTLSVRCRTSGQVSTTAIAKKNRKTAVKRPYDPARPARMVPVKKPLPLSRWSNAMSVDRLIPVHRHARVGLHWREAADLADVSIHLIQPLRRFD